MKDITWDIKWSAIIKILLTVFLVWIIIKLQSLVIVLFIAFIIAVSLRPFVKKLTKYKIPKSAAAGIIYLFLIIILSSLIYLIAQPLARQLVDLAGKLPSIISNLQTSFPFLAKYDLNGYVSNLSTNLSSSGQDLGGTVNTAIKTFSGIFDIFTSVLTIVVISFYLTLGLDGILEKLIKFIPNVNRERVLSNYKKVEEQVGFWLRGQVFLMVLIGILTFIVLKILGIPFAVPLSIFAGFMEIIPILGPIIYSVAIILVALTVNPTVAVLAVVACLIIQQVEGNVLVPQIMRKAVGISPVTTIVAIIAGGTLMGVVGALLAVPVAAVLTAIIEDLYLKEK